MSIFAYVGFPGSGKSYEVVANQILPALRAGRVVCTNMPMKTDLLKAEVTRDDGGPVDIRAFSIERALQDPNTILEDIPPGALWVVDEAYKLFPAGETVKKVPEAFKQILAEHRHRVNAEGNSMQIVFVCQDLSQIGAFARQLVETTFRMTKLTALGAYKRYRVDVFQGPQQGANPPMSARLREMMGRYDKKIFRYYISHTLSESGREGANEVSVDKRANLLRSWMTIAVPVLIGVCVWFGFHHLGSEGERLGVLAKLHKDERSHPLPGLELGTMPSAARLEGPLQSVPQARVQWYVKGVARNLDEPQLSFAVLVDAGGHRTLVRPLSSCRDAPGEPLACLLDGVWWSESGFSEIAGLATYTAAR